MSNLRVTAPLLLGWVLAGSGCDANARSKATSARQRVVFHDACDASGAVSLDRHRFAVADDEDSVLRIYDAERGGEPLYMVNVADSLDLARDEQKKKKKKPKKQQKKKPRKPPETDIEAATSIGSRAYWITSHALTKSGKRNPARFRFFATELPTREGPRALIGAPYRGLVEAMRADARLAALGIDGASRRSPDKGGLNIEGMTGTPDGKLLLGLRSPVPQGKALVFTLENPDAVLRGEQPRFGAPKLLDLGGGGVRALSWWRGSYLIIAGSADSSGISRLYRWNGSAAPEHVRSIDFTDFNPEGFFTPESRNEILVLSDDGAREVRGRRCKDLDKSSEKSFRGQWLELSGK